MIDETFIPGEVKVVAPRWVIFRRKFLCGCDTDCLYLFPMESNLLLKQPGDHYEHSKTTMWSFGSHISLVESAFERANEFIPERWYSKPEMVKNKHAFAPFGMGE